MNTTSLFSNAAMLRLVFAAILACLACLGSGCASTAPLARRAIEFNQSGASSFAAGDLSTAATRFELALEYNDRFTEAWVNLGMVEMERGQFDLAREHLRRARTLNRDLPAPHHALGLLADRLGFVKEAEENYRAALRVDPGFFPSRANLAGSLLRRRAYDDAREQFARMVETAPDQVQGWVGLSECLDRLGRDNESREIIERAPRSAASDQEARPPPQIAMPR